MSTDQPKKMGRPLGSHSKITTQARELAMATGKLPHEILLDIARGEVLYQKMQHPITKNIREEQVIPDMAMRLDAAKAAAPYYAPKIATVEVIQGVSDHDLDSIIAQLAREAGIGLGADGEGSTGEEEDSPSPSARRQIRIPD